MQTTRKITRAEWAREHEECFVCGKRYGLETHEIVRGADRAKGVKLPAAWLRLCFVCHSTVGGWPVAMQLALKKSKDPEFYERVAVNLARGRQAEAITKSEVDAYLNAKGLSE